ncbi:SDR family NAD(P)-dependent oxidoreductase [Rhizobium leguminosarum]|uniref:SDR family NAD(P)-dependent oxidoreductase n=1 Tax=Rhizobium leguminosarum TaxID=384 RepID=UPI003F9C11AD
MLKAAESLSGGVSSSGLATAKRFAEEGARVFMTGRRKEQLDAAVREVGVNARGVQGDIADLGDLDRLYQADGRGGLQWPGTHRADGHAGNLDEPAARFSANDPPAERGDPSGRQTACHRADANRDIPTPEPA